MASHLRFLFLVIIFTQSDTAKTSTENLIIDESEIYGFTNSSKIEEGNFSEEVPTNSSDYIWVVNLKKGPYSSKEKAIKATRRIRTIGRAMLRDLLRRMNDKQLKPHIDTLLNSASIVFQQKYDKDKIYSLHEHTLSVLPKAKHTNAMNLEPKPLSPGPETAELSLVL